MNTEINLDKLNQYKFISRGAWYKDGAEVECEDLWKINDDFYHGLFRGPRICKNQASEGHWHDIGEEYEDGECCALDEFDVYFNNELIRKATIIDSDNK